ncbi:MAG: cytochrome c [Bacteroidetes bacterium]|nr:cytochrome c [Bacteroidota bacterium]
MKKSIHIITGVAALSAMISACTSRGNNPGWEYAPDMVYSKGYEPYSQGDSNTINPHGMNMREPVHGTVAFGKEGYLYPYANTAEGYEAAKGLNYPAGLEDKEGRGKYLYGIYCSPCHGATGGNDGEIFKRGLGKPSWKNYQDDYIKNIPVGQIYHTLTYGKNLMGSHAYVLKPEDRWKVVRYVKELSGAGIATAAPADSASMKKTK